MGEREGYRWAVKATVIMLVVLAAVAIPVSAMVKGAPGALAASIGVGVAAIASLITQLSMLKGHTMQPTAMAGLVAFSWLGKMLVLIAILAVFGQFEDFERMPFGITAAVGVVASVVIDVVAMRTARIPNVVPGSGSGSQ